MAKDDGGLKGFEFNLGTELRGTPTLKRNDPFFLLVMGDFSGRASRGVCEPDCSDRRIYSIDCEDLESAIKALQPKIRLHSLGQEVELSSMDDFHPDQLYRSVSIFSELRQVRAELKDPQRFDATAAKLLGKETSEPEVDAAEAPAAGTDADWLGAAIDATEQEAAQAEQPENVFASMLNEIVGPHLLPSPDPRMDELIAAVDDAMSAQMRSVLHDKHFREVEAAWRGIAWLSRFIETDDKLKILLLDVSKDELAASVSQISQLSDLPLCRLLQSARVSTESLLEGLSAFVGCYSFAATGDDFLLLGLLANVAAGCRAPWIASADGSIIGVDSIATQPDPDDWKPSEEEHTGFLALGTQPEASYVSLTFPRLLGRLPYGQASEPIDAFHFEELSPDTNDPFLWMHGGFAAALAMAKAYHEDGWKLRVGGQSQLSGLPFHVDKSKGQAEQTPTAQAWLPERAIETLLQLGLSPLASRYGEDAVQLFGPRAISISDHALKGKW